MNDLDNLNEISNNLHEDENLNVISHTAVAQKNLTKTLKDLEKKKENESFNQVNKSIKQTSEDEIESSHGKLEMFNTKKHVHE